MGLINNILSLFTDNSTEVDMMVRNKKTHDVIAEMTAKYGEVTTTVRDIDKIGKEIDKKRDELMNHDRMIPSGSCQCKTTEDEYYKRRDELRAERDILNEIYRKVIIVELNKFPLNKQCTINYIADYIGIKNRSIVWDVLLSTYIGSLMDPYMCCNSEHNIRVINVSNTKIKLRASLGGNHRYSSYYNDEDGIYGMNLSNWRFVKSANSSIFYVERMS